jgi:glycosyltransferase involved in cell wall biosynthesis
MMHRDAVSPTGGCATVSRHPLAGRVVLQIIPELDAGGAERSVIEMAEALVAVGARAPVACLGGRLVPELRAHGGEFLPFPAKTKNPLAMAGNVGRLCALIREHRVDLIHARSRAPAWVALAAARRMGIPFVTTYHGSYSGKSAPKRFYNSVMARGDLVIANSGFTARLIGGLHPFASSRVTVIHDGTDLRQFTPAAVAASRVARMREAWGVAADQRIVLLAARLTGWKGHRLLIEAARLLRARGLHDVICILAGDAQGRGGYAAELDGLITAAGLDGAVRRVGHCADMPAALLASAIVVVPSTKPEAFGRTAVEAQAMGVPVVVSDLGAVPETMLAPPQVTEAGRTGWRVPPGDAAALADAIATGLATSPADRAGLAARARAPVVAQFALERTQQAGTGLYASLLQPKPVRPTDHARHHDPALASAILIAAPI